MTWAIGVIWMGFAYVALVAVLYKLHTRDERPTLALLTKRMRKLQAMFKRD